MVLRVAARNVAAAYISCAYMIDRAVYIFREGRAARREKSPFQTQYAMMTR